MSAANGAGLSTEFFGCLLHWYRFSAVLTPQTLIAELDSPTRAATVVSGIPVSGDAEIAPVASDEARLAPPHRGFGRNVLSVMRGTVLGQVVTVIATPIVSRLFSPGVFGEFTLVVSVAAAASALAGFRYETAIPLARSDDEANATFAVAMAGVVLVALLTLVLCAGFPTLPGRFRDLSALREWRFAIPALVLPRAAASPCRTWRSEIVSSKNCRGSR